MTSRRVSKETSKYFAATATATRRSTRASLARFAYQEDADSPPNSVKDEPTDLILGSDIEDAITTTTNTNRPRRATAQAPRKRKREPTSPGATTTTKVKADPEEEQDTKPRRERKPARAKTDLSTGTTIMEPPSDWEEMYGLVKEMRISGPAANAAVDTMGCERLASEDASPRDRRFHTLVALMLSSQTKDTVNAVAMARLKKELPPFEEGAPPGLNLENVLAVEPALLNELIWQVGFHNNKTKYIKQAAVILRDKYNSDIPDTIAGLTSLPGVGPKMAHLCMSAPNGWNRVEGIGVDVHVHRITNLWGWNKTNNPEATRAALESWLPRDRWREINWLLVGLGQTVCLPVGRKCGDCELGLRGLCRAADRKKVNERLRRREDVKEEKEEELVVEKQEVLLKREDEENVAPIKVETVKVELTVKEEIVDEVPPVTGFQPLPARTQRRARRL
ncbi:DNA repair protein Ntg1 [Pyricularia oryzae 70-15]|uniref:Endonuclease III homolog n=3 Tax=Pyricularia oryzae TaxID=318829 RepID=G4N4U2_PYRO7|nr:DNA repair protein Ntg1 [Pyricularia oryzae 70-15]EHA52054.1 DNA repair protein Ntg1 [Pyricularia oryzae 70-15]ELQ39938.1 DNA base excision repair N-glycosylase 1 [Pyricularia oryzae Y34]KAI7925858.1 DNA repair protein Ntg1 [Pyricularia oryzae]KAI7928434.1 DNA repair protein Ntg1 [Pyricularia oryzae]